MSLLCLQDNELTRVLRRTGWCLVVGFVLNIMMMLGAEEVNGAPDLPASQQHDSQFDAADVHNQKMFAIASGGLETALSSFAKAGGVHLVYDPALLKGRHTPGVAGRFSLDEALSRLLAGTGLSHNPNHSGVIRVVENSEAKRGETKKLQQSSDSSKANDDRQTTTPPLIKLSEVVVRETRGTGYKAETASTAMKTDTPIRETPVSIQVVPRQVIEDQAAQRLQDVYKNVSGVGESGNTLNAQSEVLPFIRGFEAPIVLRNGMRSTLVGSVDLVNIQSVEVLKGPASILFGALEPGGVLNYTTKLPLDEPYYNFKQQIGSFSLSRTTFDATGPLDTDRTWLYRLNAAYTNQGSFRDKIELERFAIAPSLTWRISEQTDVTFDLSYTHETVPYDSGIPLDADGDPLVPIETFFGDSNLAGRTLEDLFLGYLFQHRFNHVFTLRNRFQYHRANPRNEAIRHRGVIGAPGAELLRQRYQNEEREDVEYQLVTDLLANFATGGLDHKALVGIDLIRQDTDFERFRQNLADVAISSKPNVNFDPPANLQRILDFSRSTKWLALYVQDQISMLEDGRLKLLLGGRFDWVRQSDHIGSIRVTDHEFTGRAGVLYELTNWLSPYASVTQSFRPTSPTTQDRDGNGLDPETGIQYEAGLKVNLFDERLLATVALFQIQKEDVPVSDNQFFIDTGGIASIPGVNQRSQGIELDITGQITDELSVIANYAYTDTKVLKNQEDPAEVGQPLGNVPLHMARLWFAYTFGPDTFLSNLGLGAGVRYESARPVQFATAITVDEFTVFDAAAWYRYTLSSGQVLRAQLNLQNLLDKGYIIRASDQSVAHPGMPFSAIGSIGIEF
ncbi:TonB-dependent siderophore receptor [Nitrospira sp. M1]